MSGRRGFTFRDRLDEALQAAIKDGQKEDKRDDGVELKDVRKREGGGQIHGHYVQSKRCGSEIAAVLAGGVAESSKIFARERAGCG